MTATATTHAQPVVRLSGPQGIVAAAAQSLGFEPQDSLVLMCLRRPRGRVGPVARVDLVPPGDAAPVEPLVRMAQRYADDAAVICYHDGPRPACIDDVIRALRSRGVRLGDVLSVCEGRIRDARSTTRWRKDTGIPLLDVDDAQYQELAAASALVGRRVLPSRAALAASLEPDPTTIPAAERAIEQSYAAQAAELADPGGASTQADRCTALDRRWRAVLTEYHDTATVSLPAAADLIAMTTHVACRDRLVARAVAGDDPDVVPVLIAVASHCPTAHAAPICSVLTAAAYRFGEGALALCAADRALAADPGHRLTQLLMSLIDCGVPPDELRSLADLAGPTDVIGPGDPPMPRRPS